NLLLARDGVVKLLDLGLARLRQSGEEEERNRLTQVGVVLGSPDYLAPEQARDTGSVDIRADLYSLGCTFYHLLTGRVPFPAETLADVLMKHLTGTPEPVERLRPEVPEAVAAVVRKLMAKHPRDRYQTPAQLATALATLSQNLPPESRTASV